MTHKALSDIERSSTPEEGTQAYSQQIVDTFTAKTTKYSQKSVEF